MIQHLDEGWFQCDDGTIYRVQLSDDDVLIFDAYDAPLPKTDARWSKLADAFFNHFSGL